MRFAILGDILTKLVVTGRLAYLISRNTIYGFLGIFTPKYDKIPSYLD